MLLRELFRPEDVLVAFDPADKWDAIRRLIEHLAGRGRLPAPRVVEVSDAVLARERSMSTGMEHGVAIPHAAVDGVDEVVAVLGIVGRESGLDFESVDGRPTRLVVLLVIPRAKKLLHIRTLADVARGLARESVRDALIAARDSAAAWDALAQADTALR